MCVGFDAVEEMFPVTAKQAALRRVSRAWTGYEARTSSAMHRGEGPNDLYPLSSNLLIVVHVAAYHL
jgi:hypothetical protein